MATSWKADTTQMVEHKLDKFTITKTGPASYTFGPSLTLSGETVESNVETNDGNTANSNDNNGEPPGAISRTRKGT